MSERAAASPPPPLDTRKSGAEDTTVRAGLPSHVPPAAPHWVARTAYRFRSFLLRLASRLMPPQLTLFDLATGGIVARMLQQAVVLGIPDLLDGESLDATALAEKTGVQRDELHRMLRACVSAGVFRLGTDGRFSNNYLSRALRSGVGGSFKDTVDYFTSPEIDAVWGTLPDTLRSGGGGYERLHGCSVWE